MTTRTGADPGLFGPRTVTWQLHADPAMWIAGIASLHLQALHPRAVAAIVQNSDFLADPLGRLSRTASFVGLASYGTAAAAHAAAVRVRAVHRGLRAEDPDTGERYRLDDPGLLLWVHCAEVHSFLTVLLRAGYRLTPRQQDRYLDEQRRAAALVGLHADEVPGSRAELDGYLASVRPSLRRTDASEVVHRFLHRPPLRGAPRLGLGAYERVIGDLACSLLPDWAGETHGCRPWSDRVATLVLRTVRATALLVPPPIRWAVPTGHVNRAVLRLGPAAVPRRSNLPCG
jgi:uncharacterized protein (DUF2236 family)